MQTSSILGPLLFLIYNNELHSKLKTTSKLFADEMFLFTIVKDIKEVPNVLNMKLASCSQQLSFLDPKMGFHLENALQSRSQ